MPTRSATANVWTDEERAAMQSSARERKVSSRRNPEEERAQGERDYEDSVARLPEPDRSAARRVDAVVMAAVPALAHKTYYGMPAYASGGNVICWFKNASKFKMRYDTLEFSDKARLDDGDIWPASYALKALTPAVESKIAELVRKAAS
jgi:uncharacterized protein YdhG (YjbR/CyaY superfamily)